MSTTSDPAAQRRCDRLFHDPKRPILAAIAFFGCIACAAFPFVLDTDNSIVVTACFAACFCCSLLFVRLLIGRIEISPAYLLGFIGILALVAGQDWYVVVLLALTTFASDLIVQRIVGKFAPLLDGYA